MKFTEAGMNLLKKWEVLKLKAYPDDNKPPVWTIGYGHTGPEVHEGLVWTVQQAEETLLRQVHLVSAHVATSLVGAQARITDNQFSAFVCLAYNIGVPSFISSTAHRLAFLGQLDGVPAAMKRWDEDTKNGKKVVVPGLDNRRDAEVLLWNTPDNYPGVV